MTTSNSSRTYKDLEEIAEQGPFVSERQTDDFFFHLDVAKFATETLPEGDVEEFLNALEEARKADDYESASQLAFDLDFSEIDDFMMDNWGDMPISDNRFEHHSSVRDFIITTEEYDDVLGDCEWERELLVIYISPFSIRETAKGFAARLELERAARIAAQ